MLGEPLRPAEKTNISQANVVMALYKAKQFSPFSSHRLWTQQD